MPEQREADRSAGAMFSGNILKKIAGIHFPLSASDNPGEKRSAKAAAAERILRAVNDGHLSSVERSEEFLRKRAAEEDEPVSFSSLFCPDPGSFLTYHGCRLAVYGENNTGSIILYLHGGAYAEEALPFHFNFCRRLAERLGVCVLLPLYPLAPNHTWRETYDLLTDLYKDILDKKNAEITIIGDSAGGGLAIAFCQYLKTIDLPQPDHLIAISPWVDIRMTDTDYEPYRSLDPMLDVPGLQVIGKVWAGDLDVADPKVSPAFGDNKGLPKTLLFTGTREILYPDICAFYQKMLRDGCDAELVIGEGMNHDYPLYGLPESHTAIDRIDEEISGKLSRDSG